MHIQYYKEEHDNRKETVIESFKYLFWVIRQISNLKKWLEARDWDFYRDKQKDLIESCLRDLNGVISGHIQEMLDDVRTWLSEAQHFSKDPETSKRQRMRSDTEAKKISDVYNGIITEGFHVGLIMD